MLRRANVLVTSGGIVTYHGTKIGYVRLTSFTQGAGAALKAQVEKVAPPRRARRSSSTCATTGAGCSTRP